MRTGIAPAAWWAEGPEAIVTAVQVLAEADQEVSGRG